MSGRLITSMCWCCMLRISVGRMDFELSQSFNLPMSKEVISTARKSLLERQALRHLASLV
jgi:hypothetical protein